MQVVSNLLTIFYEESYTQEKQDTFKVLFMEKKGLRYSPRDTRGFVKTPRLLFFISKKNFT